MSPASAGGALEVEKYIGACLITQQRPKNTNPRDAFFHHHHQQQHRHDPFIPDAYGYYRRQQAGGLPLISFAHHQRRGRNETPPPPQPQRREGQSLARLAVQGAPLIVTRTSYNRKKPQQQKKCEVVVKPGSSVGVDAVSVASDESSDNNCLPRIIKPRKRRKKERKPLLGRPSSSQDGFSTDSASPDIDKGPFHCEPFLFERTPYSLVPEDDSTLQTSDEIQNESETPKLHHRFEDVEELADDVGVDINGNQSAIMCQCRYCDPRGQIWDVDRDCYSPFLTTPESTGSIWGGSQCLVRGMSSLVIGMKEIGGGNDGKIVISPPTDLEVSTEIVTSLNGHRDIEIKFFSPSSVENNGGGGGSRAISMCR